MSYDVRWILANRVERIGSSPFVELGANIKREDMIYFTGGTPPPDRVPSEKLGRSIAKAWETARDIYSYGDSQGYEALRELISERMATRGVRDASPESILITNGSQQGLDIVARILFDPGDQLIVEGPTYFGALQAFDPYEVEYLIASMDEQGLVPDSLESLAGSPRVKAIYTISIFQNPAGVTISPQRRSQILEIARHHNLVVIEDDPYGELSFTDSVPVPLRADDQDVVYLGTFSKTLMPALRIGWMVLPEALRTYAIDTKEAVDIQSDRFVQRAIVDAARDGWLDDHIRESRAAYHKRYQHLTRSLEQYLPDDARWTTPGGGFFVWVDLPEQFDTEVLAEAAVAEGVVVLPGSFFYPDRRRSSALRLGFTTLSVVEIEEGVRRLGTAIRNFH